MLKLEASPSKTWVEPSKLRTNDMESKIVYVLLVWKAIFNQDDKPPFRH